MRISDWSSDVCSSDLWRSASWPSRASSLKLGQDQMSAVTPKSLSSSSAAALTSRRMVPEPISWTRCSPFLGLPGALNDRKSVVSGTGVSVSVECGGRRYHKKKRNNNKSIHDNDNTIYK